MLWTVWKWKHVSRGPILPWLTFLFLIDSTHHSFLHFSQGEIRASDFFPSPFLFVFLSYGLHLMSGPFLNQWSIISQNFRQSLVWVTDQQGETLPSGILYFRAWSHFFPFLLSLTCFNICLIWHECEPVNSVSLHCKCPMNCGWDKNSHFVDQREMLFSALAFKNSGSQAV